MVGCSVSKSCGGPIVSLVTVTRYSVVISEAVESSSVVVFIKILLVSVGVVNGEVSSGDVLFDSPTTVDVESNVDDFGTSVSILVGTVPSDNVVGGNNVVVVGRT